MSSADWNEIKRLAADFQRAQLTSSLQRLSERNCVEIINKLIELKLLEVYFTSNGKEYITPSQLSKEIREELYVHRGRINIAELCSLLNVDLKVIEKLASDIAQSDSSIHIVLGQLISEDYLDVLAEEVNEKLQQNGSITVGDVAKLYDLPGEFLLRVICKRFGKIVKGLQDENDHQTIFTEAYIARHKSQIRGVLSAITHPTPVSNVISLYQFQERLFFTVAEKLISTKALAGIITGGRIATEAVYIPDIYSKAQYNWVDSFLKQNGYLEFEALHRLGISDPQSYIKRHFKEESLTFVPGACVGQFFINQIDANLDDALVHGGFVDVSPFLPSGFSNEVCTNLIDLALKSRQANAKATACSNNSSNCQIFCDTIVVSENLITKMSMSLEQIMPTKAQEAISNGAFKHQLSSGKNRHDEEASSKGKKDDRRKKAAGGKAGGGTQGRETKTKSTKNKYKGRRGAQESDDEETVEPLQKGLKPSDVEFLSLREIQSEISKSLELDECPDELLEELASYFYEPMTRKFQEIAKATFLATMAGGGDSRKKTHSQMQEKVTMLLTTIRLAEKGTKEFSDDTQGQLCKYLLRTHCSELLNELVLYLADDSQIDLKSDKEISPEFRLKIINQLENELKQPLLAVHKSLTGASLDLFLSHIDDALFAADILLKKKDNKKDKQVLLNHRSGLVDQLHVSLNSALTLHLACLTIFQAVTGNLLHASGKFVPQILAFLKPHLPQEFFFILQEYQGLVMKSLTLKNEDDNLSSINTSLEELTPKVKELTITFKKVQRERETSFSKE